MTTTNELQERRWGSGALNLDERTLPTLKAERVLNAIFSLPKGSKVLDYGCGEGKLLYTIRKYRPDLVFFGIDVQKPLKTPEFDFALVENEECAFFNKKFDAILSLDVLEHVPDLEQTFIRLKNMLEHKGVLILFVPMEGEPGSPFGFYRWLLGPDVYVKTKSHVHAYRRSKFLPLLRKYFVTEEISFSYHIIGTLLDSTFFALTSLSFLSKWFWKSNSIYHPENKKKGLMNRVMELANWCCYHESNFLKHVGLFASGLHIKAKVKN